VQIFSLKIQCTVILDTMNLKNWGGGGGGGGFSPLVPPLLYTLVMGVHFSQCMVWKKFNVHCGDLCS